jgi:hypothetical protein
MPPLVTSIGSSTLEYRVVGQKPTDIEMSSTEFHLHYASFDWRPV